MDNNPFRNLTKEEVKRNEEEARRVELKIKTAVESARACFASTSFAKYRDDVKEAREGLIKLMKLNGETDPIKFAFFCKACLSKIDAFDMMIEEIEKDVKRGK